MSYLALARKWRPRTFSDLVGQPHIVRALTNALNSGRIHHAFLFAGTRGIGKTTAARILARCLNCEQGVTATPCGECRACKAIEEGRFVDLIEVDAASRTGVDDTRELLENVQYTPSAGRFKVYLIDEVHMLSKQAFNALLKTLEEPPPHVKFLFATTDPQKLPVTVLSRCLQFNLKRLSAASIVDRMQHICQAEGIRTEGAALNRLARAAAGSMRDALSLLDQAVAYGNESLLEHDVAEMLGTMDRSRVLTLLQAVAQGDPAALMARIRELDELVPDYGSVLEDLATCLQRIAVLQLAGADSLDEEDLTPALQELAGQVDPESVQLCYQIAITSRRDLAWAPEPRAGFEMALLRMVAFRPETAAAPPERRTPPAPGVAPRPAGEKQRSSPALRPAARPPAAGVPSPGNWPAFVEALPLEGAARQLALHTALLQISGSDVRLGVERANSHLLTDQLKTRVNAAISDSLGGQRRVVFEIRDAPADTSAARQDRRSQEALRKARETLAQDPDVKELVDLFGAEVIPDSVKPLTDGEDRG
jgi:DNA polymerase-3 subunit gamma/tau